MKEVINKVFETIKEFFTNRCPDCNGKMINEFYDPTIKKEVYQCTVCGKEWV